MDDATVEAIAAKVAQTYGWCSKAMARQIIAVVAEQLPPTGGYQCAQCNYVGSKSEVRHHISDNHVALPDPRPTEAEVQEAHLRETHCPAWKWQMDLLRRAGCFRPEPVPTTEAPRG